MEPVVEDDGPEALGPLEERKAKARMTLHRSRLQVLTSCNPYSDIAFLLLARRENYVSLTTSLQLSVLDWKTLGHWVVAGRFSKN
jgi:hypothetical protein